MIEVKVGQHITKLMKRLQYMEVHKRTKPSFSQSCDRLLERITELMTDHEGNSIDEQESYQYWSQLKSQQIEHEPSFVPPEDESPEQLRTQRNMTERNISSNVKAILNNIYFRMEKLG